MRSFIKRIMIFSIISVTLFGFNSMSVNAEWKNDNGNWSYLTNNGTKVTGWLKDNDGKWYYLKADGIMLSNNWLNDNGKWYYLDNNGVWNPNVTNNPNVVNNNNLPISIPSTWRNLGDNKYAINGRSVVTYSVEDMTGWTQESVMNDIRKITYQQGNYDSDIGLVTYNGNNGYAYSYTSITKDGMRKILYIIMFKNSKHYDFIFISDYVNYDIDRKELENVLNSSLNI